MRQGPLVLPCVACFSTLRTLLFCLPHRCILRPDLQRVFLASGVLGFCSLLLGSRLSQRVLHRHYLRDDGLYASVNIPVALRLAGW